MTCILRRTQFTRNLMLLVFSPNRLPQRCRYGLSKSIDGTHAARESMFPVFNRDTATVSLASGSPVTCPEQSYKHQTDTTMILSGWDAL